MDLPLELSLEQQFSLKRYQEEVKGLSPEESQRCLLEVMRQLMLKDNVIRHLLAQTM